jgi:Cu2+-exporting ATPase
MAEMELVQIRILGTMNESRCIAIAAALERDSRHPIARAFQNLSKELSADGIRHISGVGVEGSISGHHYRLSAAPDSVSQSAPRTTGNTWVELSGEAGPLARFELGTRLRPDAASTVSALQARGLQVLILSGDSETATSALAGRLRVDGYGSRQSPAGKLARVESLQTGGARVLAVGDGINDAPLLAAAHLSAAMPNGAAVTQSKADLVLVGEALAGLLTAIDVAHHAKSRIRENLLWALLYNLAVIPLAASGMLEPWMAAAGMSLSSLLVAGNALRLGRGRGAASHDDSRRLAEVH